MREQEIDTTLPLFAEINALLQEADIEGLIASGSPPDEYAIEAEILARAFSTLEDAEFTEDNLMEIIAYVWSDSFDLENDDLNARIGKIESLIAEILKLR